MSHALELLSSRFSDLAVREYAVATLGMLSDGVLGDLLLQLVQALKAELRHDSMLARMLLRRALCSPHTIGHRLFWLLRSEMHAPNAHERFGLLLWLYALRAKPHVAVLAKQLAVTAALERIALGALRYKHDDGEQKVWVQKKMAALEDELPAEFTLPLSSKMKCNGIVAAKCRVMDSKQAPIWVTFRNADVMGGVISVIFKCGDDLRQDVR